MFSMWFTMLNAVHITLEEFYSERNPSGKCYYFHVTDEQTEAQGT